ncbi:MAG TPA: tellurite resistance/C4-dicarboxylate transporter family protein [Nocardioidaceae bacterium]|nr:tellurite resistance/C4-dicarboxylate transporter family protein [Nocardioidaceae bacterium]
MRAGGGERRSGAVGERVRRAVRTLAPGYFALVMATGIISLGMRLRGFHALSAALLVLCAASWVVLTALTTWRLLAFGVDLARDFTDARRAFGFFTVVAGTNVLGVRLGVAGFPAVTAGLLAAAGLLWVALGYVVPWTSVLSREERPVIRFANGTWFIWVVASQSVAAAAATIEPTFTTGRRELALCAVVAWSVGACLYLAVGVMVAMRMLWYPLQPDELKPPYWVSMGALAITVLAAARIVQMADAPMVEATRGLIAGAAVVLWAFASWLIPVLVAAGWWRHRTHRVPLRYDPTLWSIVFPLGMYAVASAYLGDADRLPLVGVVGSVELWVAFAAWLAVGAAMLGHLWRTVAIGDIKSEEFV